MPEGDTLHRTANGLSPHLVGRAVTAARVRPGGPQVQRIVGATISSVEALGKNLLIRFDNGLEIRTHLRMNGSWHRYRPGERWRRSPARARLVLEVPGAVAVCFDAPVVELFETRAEAIHPTFAALGPDLLDAAWTDAHEDEAVRRLADPDRAALTISAALLDQRALAGIGNIWRNETLFHERLGPWVRVADLDESDLRRLVRRARELLRASVILPPGRSPMWVYGRAGRPCRRCGTLVRSAPQDTTVARTTYWCPACQAGNGSDDGGDRRPL
ncbi:MAG TPA: DNA-formamidopyrimidine glycosylase family protein [Candidatus Limnocylindrales bacterium]|nr:DNA-formamidopyrimidine glycosylase family protein [Candidatus Limnocylindrales bacterium]